MPERTEAERRLSREAAPLLARLAAIQNEYAQFGARRNAAVHLRDKPVLGAQARLDALHAEERRVVLALARLRLEGYPIPKLW